jgi:mannose-6-phosphate isomerase
MREVRSAGVCGVGGSAVRYAADGAPGGASAVRDQSRRGLAAVALPPNPVFRFYRGGPGIDAVRGLEPGTGPGAPEDWVGSTTTSFGHDSEGLATLSDGRVLRDVIAADPIGYLGKAHVERFGASSGILVKLLDTAERLAVHFHPGREFARAELGSQFGKTEAWIILRAEPGAELRLGLRAPVDLATLKRWVHDQDSAAMLAALNPVPVVAGDVLFVPAGTLHTIGAGITLIELQEPSDMSVVLEWQLSGVDNGDEHLQLGWDRVLAAADTAPGSAAHGSRSLTTAGTGVESLLPTEADPFFRAQRVSVDGHELSLAPSFAILIALDGELTLTTKSHAPLHLTQGDAALVPHGAGETNVSGHGTAIRCRPPDPGAREGRR